MSSTDVSPRPGLLATITEHRFLALLNESDTPLSRSDIAQLAGISKPAISDAARRLEDAGVIVTTGIREGRRGGVAALYEINPARGHPWLHAGEIVFFQIRMRHPEGMRVCGHVLA